MNLIEYRQRIIEYRSLSKSTSPAVMGKVLRPEIDKLNEIANKEGFDSDAIFKEVANIERRNKKRDIVLSKIKPRCNNPITDELAEALLDQFSELGFISIRRINLKSGKKRGLNTVKLEEIKALEKESMNVGLEIFLNNIKSGNLDKVNQHYYSEIKKIGIDKLEKYLQTGKTTKDLDVFLAKVYDSCFSLFTELIGSPNESTRQSLHRYKDNSVLFRMYFNMPLNSSTIEFVRDYQIACQKLGIDYEMKAFKNMESVANDTTIFYSSYADFDIKLKLIKELLKKYPNMELCTPPAACATLSDMPNVGICHIGILSKFNGIYKNTATYNDYIDKLADISLAKIFETQLSRISPDIKKRIEKVKNGDVRTGMDGLRAGIRFSGEERIKARQVISSLLADPLKKKIFVKAFKSQMQIEHNINQGYSQNSDSNVALETFLIDEFKVLELEPERKTKKSNERMF